MIFYMLHVGSHHTSSCPASSAIAQQLELIHGMVAHRNHETCCSIAILEYSGTYSRTYCNIGNDRVSILQYGLQRPKQNPAAEILLIRAEINVFSISP